MASNWFIRLFRKKDESPRIKGFRSKKDLKKFEFDLMLNWNGAHLHKIAMTIQAKDRADAKTQIMHLIDFQISRLVESKEKTNEKSKL